MKAYERLYPQLVELVNEIKAKIVTSVDEPLNVTMSNVLNSSGTALQITDQSTHANEVRVIPVSGRYNVQVSALFLQDTRTSTVTVVPISQSYYNLTTAQISTMETAFHVWNNLYPATTSAKVIYSTISHDLSIQQYIYVLQSGT